METLIKGPWGMAIPANILCEAIKSWGPKPLFLNVEGIYFPKDLVEPSTIDKIESILKPKFPQMLKSLL